MLVEWMCEVAHRKMAFNLSRVEFHSQRLRTNENRFPMSLCRFSDKNRAWPFSVIMRIGSVMLFPLILIAQVESAELRHPKEHLPGLVTAQTVLIDLTVASTLGMVDPTRVLEIVSNRMEELGYDVVTHKQRTHDVVVQLTCEETKTRKPAATFAQSSSFDLGEKKSSLVPPCLLNYQFQGKPIPWQRVDRIIYSEGVNTANQIIPENSGAFIISYLKQFEFPLLLSAEWGQTERLFRILQSSQTNIIRKKMIIALLGETQADHALPILRHALKNRALVADAARALGHFGKQARPYLIALLENSSNPDILAAAANGLGRVGAITGDTSSTSILLQVLNRPHTDWLVQTEVVWALGKAPDFGAFPALAKLEREIWVVQSKDPQLQQLRKAVDWSIREVRQGGHTDDY